jgi:hypothetical protein
LKSVHRKRQHQTKIKDLFLKNLNKNEKYCKSNN